MPALLQLVGLELVEQADAAAFLGDVEQHAPALLSIIASADSSCSPQSQRSEPKTSPVRHSECTRTSTSARAVDVAHDERDVVLAVDELAVADGLEVAEAGRQLRRRDALDELLVAAAVGDEVGDGDDLQVVALAVLDEVADARHRAVVVHDLADHAGRVQAGEAGEVDGGLGLAGALEHAAGAAFSGKMCPGWTRSRGVLSGSIATWIVRARSCAEMPVVTPSRASIETVNGVSKGDSFFAAMRSRPSSSQRCGVSDRQIRPRPWVAMKFIGLGRRELRGDREVALVLAILVVGDDDHPPWRMSSSASSIVANGLCFVELMAFSFANRPDGHALPSMSTIATRAPPRRSPTSPRPP